MTGAWVSDPVAENPRLVNDAITQKWKINKVSADPLNIPLASTFLTADVTSPNDEYNTTPSASKGTKNMTDSSEQMINKATMPEGRPTVAIIFLPAKTISILTPRKRFGNLIDKGMANEEESALRLVEEGDVFKIKENLPPAHNIKYFESRDSGFERNALVAIDNTKSLSQLSSSIPSAEVTITDRGLTIPGEENVDVLYDVTKSANDKTHFKTMATKTIVDGLHESEAVKQNVEAADSTELLPLSNSFFQTGRMDDHINPNLYYNVITDNLLTITKKNPNVPQNIRKHRLSLSTMEDADLTDHRSGYQTPAAIASNSAKRLANKGGRAETEMTHVPLGITTVADDISYEHKNTEVVTDLASIAAISPRKKGILTMNEVNTLNSKPNKLGDDFAISRDDPNVSRDDGTQLVADYSTFMKSLASFNHPQATNPVKKTSLADIIILKTFHYKSIPAACQ